MIQLKADTDMKLTKRKHPDHLADSCKHLSVNWMAAGSRLPMQVQSWIFSPFSTFSNILSVTTLTGVLQTFSTCVVNKNKIKTIVAKQSETSC